MPAPSPSLQLRLPFPAAPPDRTSLIRFPGNTEALAALDRWRDWPDRVLVLAGAADTGKSYISSLWASETGAARLHPGILARMPLDAVADVAGSPVVLDDASQVRDPATLLHLLNLITQRGGTLLMTGRKVPTLWKSALGDLTSRLAALRVVSLSLPDDEVVAELIRRGASRRGIALDDATCKAVLTRMDRSFSAAAAFVDAFDAEISRRPGASASTLARGAVAALYPAP